MPVDLQPGDLTHAHWQLRVFRQVARAVFRLCFRVRVTGRAHLPPAPFVVCANHLGWADIFLLLLFLPVEPRIYILGSENVRHQTAFRTWVINSLQILVPVDTAKQVRAVRQAEAVLQRRASLLTFPEGTVYGTAEGRLLPLQEGVAYLSQVTGAPLVPVGLTGTKELWLRRPLTLRIGRALRPEAFAGDRRERTRAMTAALTTAMQALLPGDQAHPRVKPLRTWLTNLFA